jgi:hypothetical protein
MGEYSAFGHVSRNITGDEWMNSNRICYIKRDLLVCVEEENFSKISIHNMLCCLCEELRGTLENLMYLELLSKKRNFNIEFRIAANVGSPR